MGLCMIFCKSEPIPLVFIMQHQDKALEARTYFFQQKNEAFCLCMQALTYDVRKQRDEDRKEFMQGGAAAVIQVSNSNFYSEHIVNAPDVI